MPQPWGAPLYISLGHFIRLFVDSSSMPWAMAFWLSAVPSGIAVGFVYLICKELKLSEGLSILGAGLLLGCGIFLTQAVVVREHALPAAFAVVALWFYVRKSYKMTALMLGLGSAVHVIVGVMSLFWLIVCWREFKPYLKQMLAIWFTVGAGPYILIMTMMAMDTPRWLCGPLSIRSIDNWLGSVGTIGTMSVWDLPKRILHFSVILPAAFGLALIPIVAGAWKQWDRRVKRVLLASFGLTLWLYFTNFDETTWTYLCFGVAMASILAVVGLSKMPTWTTKAIILSCVVLLTVNAVVLNNRWLNDKHPEAMTYWESLQAIPPDSAIITMGGGPYQLGAIYATTQPWGDNIAPIYLIEREEDYKDTDDLKSLNHGYRSYVKYLCESRGLTGLYWYELAISSMETGRPLYIVYDKQSDDWKEKIDARFVMEPFDTTFRKATGLTEYAIQEHEGILQDSDS